MIVNAIKILDEKQKLAEYRKIYYKMRKNNLKISR